MEHNFDAGTMAMLPLPLPTFDPHSHSLLTPLDSPDHLMNLDLDAFTGCGMQPQRQQDLRRFTGQYEDSLSDVVSSYDTAGGNIEGLLSTENLALDRDNKLLSFSPVTQNYALLDYTYCRVSVSVTAQLHGMFCLGDAASQVGDETALSPLAVTCYRRNLFSISGSISMPRSLRYILTESLEQIPIMSLEVVLLATESIEGHATKMISVPFKSIAKNIQNSEEKLDKEPPTVPLDLTAGAEMDPEHANIPISWTRLQFRNSTANNGRRKELQQHFTVTMRVMATLSTGQHVAICEASSNPIVVRGRSPRNFLNRNPPAPTSGSVNSQKPPLARITSNSSVTSLPPVKVEFPPATVAGSETLSPDLLSPDAWNWRIPSTQAASMTGVSGTHGLPLSPDDYLVHSSPEQMRYTNNKRPYAPVHLSLAEEEGSKSSLNPPRRSGSVNKAPRLSHGQFHRPSSYSLPTISGSENDESADLLYEYFPLGLDDWQEPVDAVYRPHAVHHIHLPTDPKTAAIRNKSKRYFSEAVEKIFLRGS